METIKTVAIESYVAEVSRLAKTGKATEHTFRGALAALDAATMESVKWQEVQPTEPMLFFAPRDTEGEEEWNNAFGIAELMKVNGMGIITKRDTLCIHEDPEDARTAADDIVSLSKEEFYRRHDVPPDVRDWRYEWARKDVVDHGATREMIKAIAYRPFDTKFSYYSGVARGFMGWPVVKIFQHFNARDNLGFCLIKICSRDDDLPVFITDKITDKTILSSKDNANVFPLYLYEENMGKVEKRANLDKDIVAKLRVSREVPCRRR